MILFTIGNIGSRIITFLLVSLYTYTLATGECEIADLITSISILLIPIMIANKQRGEH